MMNGYEFEYAFYMLIIHQLSLTSLHSYRIPIEIKAGEYGACSIYVKAFKALQGDMDCATIFIKV